MIPKKLLRSRLQESSVQPYCDDPLADEEWLKEDRKMKDLEDKLQIELKK